MEHISRLLSQARSEIQNLASPTTPPSTSDPWEPNLDAYEPSLVVAAAEAKRFVAEMRAHPQVTRAHPGRWLTLSGLYGCGKTHLAKQIFTEAERINPASYKNAPFWEADPDGKAQRRPKARWHSERSFSSIVRGGDWGYPYYLGSDFFVCLDDLGSERDNSAFIATNLFDLANARCGKWTLFTTNLTLAEIDARVDGRLASRLIRDDNVFIRIKARDYALQPKPALL